MNRVKFYLFGRFCFEEDKTLIHKIEPRKAEELLGYLLLYRDQPHSREQLADLLWKDISQEQASNYLRKVLWQLQCALERYGLSELGLLLVNGEWIQVNPQFELWLDIVVFEEAFKKSQNMLGRDFEEGQTQVIQRAVEIYRGDLLEGWYQDWCIYERERLQHQYLVMLDKLMDYCEAHQQYEDGLVHGEKILRYDRAREHTHRRLMRMYYLSGDRTAALRQYRKCMETLREELDVEPAQSTRQLLEMIRVDKLEHTQYSVKSTGNRITKTGEISLRRLFSHLNNCQNKLTKIQMQLAQDIRTIQKTL